MTATMAFFVGMALGSLMGLLSMSLAVIAKSSEEDYTLLKMNKAQADHSDPSHPE